jgi:predicted permease
MRLEQWLYALPLRLRSLFRRRRLEQELDEELRFHLDREIHEAIARGEDPGEARRRALLALRDVEKCKEECRDMRHTNTIDNLLRDFAYAGRTLRKSPAFAATAVITLALGIGASTAIFSVTNAVLLRPLPYPDAGRLVLVFWESQAFRSFLFSNADFIDLRAGTGAVFDDLGGVASFRAFAPRADGILEQLSKAVVTTNFFPLMGAHVIRGRDFTEADAAPQPHQPDVLIPPGTAAILSYEYWQRRYNGSDAVLGQEMLLSGQRGPRIVGVLGPGFRLFIPPGSGVDAAPDFWVANNVGYDAAHRGLLMAGAIGRLKSGLTRKQAQERLDAIRPNARKASFDPDAPLRLEPMGQYLVKGARPAILALMGAVSFLLLIACANVANLLLVRASLRERELAVRSALGGSWRRLVSQTLAEALLLSALGTALGVILAWAGLHAFLGLAPATLPRIETATLDWHVLTFAASAGLAAVVLFGLIPAIRAARPDVVRVLHGGRTAGLGSGRLLRNTVVIAEVALSFVLLVGSGLMFRSFLELRRINPGYDAHGLLTFFVTRDWQLTRQQGRIELLRQIRDRLRAIPGVENVSEALAVPLGGGTPPPNSNIAPPQLGSPPSAVGADFEQVMPGYFETLRTPLLAGRTFTEDDNAPGRITIVVNQLFAARAFPNQSAVGKNVLLPGPGARLAEVIGVVAPQRLFSLSDPGRETVYFSDGSWGIGVSRYWMLRTSGDSAKFAAAACVEIANVDRQLVVSKVRTMETLVDHDQAGTRLSLLLIGIFAVIAVLLASMGLYGVLATAVRQRTAEIGVRMALGANPASIFQLVVGQGLRLTAMGLAMGLLAALGLTRVMTTMLVGIKATDPATFAAMTLIFFLIAAVASWVPAARAAGLDANAALREE